MRSRKAATSLEPVTEYSNLEDFLSIGSLDSGRFAISYGGVPVDFYYDAVENAKATIVMFHGSTRKDVNLPMLAGAGITSGLAVNRLAVSDPSLTADSSCELILSWYAGSSQQPELQYFLERVIRRISALSGTQNLIFMGGSGGGFASLEISRRFEKSVALVMNPQTSLGRYYPALVTQYLNNCWNGLASVTMLPSSIAHDLVGDYPQELNHTVAYLQNTRDKHHVDNHQAPFLKKSGGSQKVFVLMDAWGDPTKKSHVPPPREIIRSILTGLIESDGDWASCLLELGFNRNSTIEEVKQIVASANACLPTQQEIDKM